MGAAENKATVRAMYEAFVRADIDSLLAAIAEDVIWTNHSAATSTFSGRYEGQDGVRQHFASLDAIEMTKFDAQTLLADGDRVVAVLEMPYKVKATGEAHEGSGVHAWKFREGKVVRLDMWVGFDG